MQHRRRALSGTVRALHDPLRTLDTAESTLLGPWLSRQRRARPGTVRAPQGLTLGLTARITCRIQLSSPNRVLCCCIGAVLDQELWEVTHNEAESTRRNHLLRYQHHAQPGTVRPTEDIR